VTLRLGDLAPDFVAPSTQGALRFHEYLGDGWGVLFSHPRDFTPVCTTELGAVAALQAEWARRQVRVVGLAVDAVADHIRWVRDIVAVTGATPYFPLVGDADRGVATLYDMVHPNALDTATVRSVFVISPDKRIQLLQTYPAALGRSFSELLRAIDGLQRAWKHPGVATPADWVVGEDVLLEPDVTLEDADARFPSHRTLLPYLRTAPDPGAGEPREG
jgi:thioredoxin-dependent peroxiredoxin